MSERLKKQIEGQLRTFADSPLREAGTNLLNTLGYHSRRTSTPGIDAERHRRLLDAAAQIRGATDTLRSDDWDAFHFLFQLTDEEMHAQQTVFESQTIDDALMRSYLFAALKLFGDAYTRTQLVNITRFLNKQLPQPIMVMFHYGHFLTLAIINRRWDKRENAAAVGRDRRQVLEKVTLIRDINLSAPNRAHLDILAEFALDSLVQTHAVHTFETLHKAWEGVLNTEALNRKFYGELYAWYQWAVAECRFPDEANPVQVIRLITRLLFIWFLKEKGLVPEELFEKTAAAGHLNQFSSETSDYYQAILQNLFFATLNTPIDKRAFSTRRRRTHRDANKYRYADVLNNPDAFLASLRQVPFVNGGLFDCLDTFEGTRAGGTRIDCFTDDAHARQHLHVPAKLFFDENAGLFPLFSRYKFTVEENTPVEQEVALDPELLGKVFENLLAAHNPETGTTARKQTGSYYTPRDIVDYMVDEALIAVFKQKCPPTDGDAKLWDERLRYLLDYAQEFDDANEWFDADETENLVRAISALTLLDPAVGSGAFPMGVLHKLTLVLRRLDADNTRWERLQKERAQQRATAAFDTTDDDTRREELLEIDATFKRYRDSDFGRKLYLIQNCLYGVDIQPVACQIAKLRFFISLAIEQEPDSDAENFGIRPLPNLETRFLAANTLLGLREEQTLTSQRTQELERELTRNGERHFHAITRQQKQACKEKDETLRAALAAELRDVGMPAADAEKIASWARYDTHAVAEWFSPERMFGIRDGFDIVIGNPPYIQLQKNRGALGRLYQDAGFETFARTGDIYCLFYERGVKLLADNGHLCYITSNKWMRAGYGKALRRFFVENIHPIKLLDLGPDIFDATVDTNILLCSRAPTVPVARGPVPREAIACTVTEKYKHSATSLATYTAENGVHFPMPEPGAQWSILSDIERQIQAKIEAVGMPLKEWDISISYGLKTGYNAAFVIDNQTKEALIAADPKSAEIIKPVLRGRDIKRYHVNWAGFWLIDTHNGYDDVPAIDVNEYGAVKIHLDRFYSHLAKRRSKGATPYHLVGCAYHAAFEDAKVVYPETAHAANFFYDDGEYFIEKTCFMITGRDLKILVGLLSSTLLTFAYKQFYCGTVLGKRGYQYNKHSLETLPVVQIPEAEQASFIALVDQILAAKKADSDADTSDLEKAIDKRVYTLYELTPAEIAFVEAGS